ncbi:unnamed protein product [Angiostrongylus costaricensis]|uniref:Uncharacterized protein n=1 Tax=Angiostrongylus costaricensis TaxID=334426 RepID=A0A0R3Q1J9_ANGCS|nr:unnamed protein product [Angiostrongylus costaricensis]
MAVIARTSPTAQAPALHCCGATGCSDYAIFGGYPTSCQCLTNPAQVRLLLMKSLRSLLISCQ